MRIDIITPEETAFGGEADSITIPTGDGEITVLGNHIPLVSTLMPGAIIIRQGKEEQFFAVSRGVVEIGHNHVRILSDIADRAESLEQTAIEEAKTRAEKALAEKDRADTEGFTEATAILDREIARLKSIRRRGTSRFRS